MAAYSDEVDEASIREYVATACPGVDIQIASAETGAPELAWGDTFLIYDESLFGGGGEPDFTVLDRLLPHPVYGRNHFVCVLNPSDATFEALKPHLAEAYAIAVARHRRG